MKKIIPIIVILLIAIVWFSWKSMNKDETVQETPEQILDNSTQADTTDEIEVKLDTVDVDFNSTEDFQSIDSEINSI